MTTNEVIQKLKSMGTEQTRKTYRRHGVQGELFGVSYAGYSALKKQIRVDADLAGQLWKSGNHDARILATMIVDPAEGLRLLDDWVKDLDSYPIVDALATFAAQTAVDAKKVEKWMNSKDEWTGSFGWTLFARLAREDAHFSDASLASYLDVIERNIHRATNRVRHSMNSGLISIGARNKDLQKKALAVAARIGKVEVDHGDTDCKTPDAAQYILKIAARNARSRSAKA